MGPVCRKGFKKLSEEARTAVNAMTYELAVLVQEGRNFEAFVLTQELRVHGLDKVADKIEKRIGAIVVATAANGFDVTAPFNSEAVGSWRRVGRWNKDLKVWNVPAANRANLWTLLKEHYAGMVGKSEKGPFEIAA
jgi:hypothetical protein